ncbi:hypothetical protein HanXRQr2_Chr14g0637871 [Helianthus annuus]|nr:hypothetical protein HanXRQr2_Chr14g0637871 [Helianthus annuus]
MFLYGIVAVMGFLMLRCTLCTQMKMTTRQGFRNVKRTRRRRYTRKRCAIKVWMSSLPDGDHYVIKNRTRILKLPH